jgi:hypothetical protein
VISLNPFNLERTLREGDLPDDVIVQCETSDDTSLTVPSGDTLLTIGTGIHPAVESLISLENKLVCYKCKHDCKGNGDPAICPFFEEGEGESTEYFTGTSILNQPWFPSINTMIPSLPYPLSLGSFDATPHMALASCEERGNLMTHITDTLSHILERTSLRPVIMFMNPATATRLINNFNPSEPTGSFTLFGMEVRLSEVIPYNVALLSTDITVTTDHTHNHVVIHGTGSVRYIYTMSFLEESHIFNSGMTEVGIKLHAEWRYNHGRYSRRDPAGGSWDNNTR